jgi:hypothetical protein
MGLTPWKSGVNAVEKRALTPGVQMNGISSEIGQKERQNSCSLLSLPAAAAELSGGF